jgi:predicted phosphodiesterase
VVNIYVIYSRLQQTKNTARISSRLEWGYVMRFNKCLVLKIVFSLLLMFFLIHFLSPTNILVGPFELEGYLKFPGRGNTFIHFPPLGKVVAQTHTSLLDFNISLRGIDTEQLLPYLNGIMQTGLSTDTIANEIKKGFLKYVVSLFIFVFFLGMVSSLLWTRLWTRNKIDKKEMVLLGTVNLAVLFLLLFIAINSYNQEAFSEAEYEGMLEAAPWVLKALDGGTQVINNMGLQFVEVVNNLSYLQKEMEKDGPEDLKKGSKKVLHVSDIHNNPAAFQFIRRIAETFSVDLIIDTGDLFDYGTTFEAELMRKNLQEINIPYIFIPGNHESPSQVAYLKDNLENITVLEGETIEVAELRIFGLADPASYSLELILQDPDMLEENAKRLYEMVNKSGTVDIIATHDPKSFKYLRSNNNLLLAGHTHSPYIIKEDNFIEINAGTAGASGIRGLQNLEMDFCLVLLTFQETENKSYLPITADLIKVKHYPLNFSLERFLLHT